MLYLKGKSHNLSLYFFILLITVTLTTVFFPYSRDYFFLFDDLSQLNSVSSLSISEIFKSPIAGTYRPLGYFFWKMNLTVFGWENSEIFSLINLITHCLNAFLLATVLRVFDESKLVAWSAASLFLCFPAMSEALFWMTGGHDVFGMPFLLASLISAGSMLKASDAWIRMFWGIGLFLGNLLALLSKETAYVAFPIAFSLWFISGRSIRKDKQILGIWLALYGAAFALFIYFRSLYIPISQSHYGSPLEMFLKPEIFRNIATNFKALFAFGYFGDQDQISKLFPAGSLLLAMLYAIAALKRIGLISLLTISLILSLIITGFIGIGAGSVVSGRLLYTSSMILSIIIANGIAVLCSSGTKFRLWNPGALGLCAIVIIQHLSIRSYSQRFREATSIARNVMWQILPLTEHPNVHIKNLPRFLYEGPHILKCYAFPIYFRHVFGKTANFRCDQVNLVSYADGYREIDSRVPDQYSDYLEPREGEKPIELGFISPRNCQAANPRSCLDRLADNKHPVFSIIHGCPNIDDVLFSTNLNEVQMLTFSGNWAKNCQDGAYKLQNLILFSEGSDLKNRVPLYRCGAKGYHFISLDSNCLGNIVEGILGYISQTPDSVAKIRATGCFGKNSWKPAFDQPCLHHNREEILGYVELTKTFDLQAVN